LAKATVEKFPSIQFYAVSCDKYQSICNEYDVQDFPSLRLFSIDDVNPKSKGLPVESHSRLSPKTIAKDLNVISIGRVLPVVNSVPEEADDNDEPETEQESESEDTEVSEQKLDED
jgi:hypothetical protein